MREIVINWWRTGTIRPSRPMCRERPPAPLSLLVTVGGSAWLSSPADSRPEGLTDTPRYRYQLGIALSGLRREEEARAAWRTAVEAGHARSWSALGRFLPAVGSQAGGYCLPARGRTRGYICGHRAWRNSRRTSRPSASARRSRSIDLLVGARRCALRCRGNANAGHAVRVRNGRQARFGCGAPFL